jgi:Kef-type K+ transport system membrane component KefB
MVFPLLAITAVLLASFIAAELSVHFKYPRVLGQVIAGTIIGLPVFANVITESARHDIAFLAQLGVIFLFLVIGMKIDISHLKRERRQSLIVGGMSIVIPLLLGYSVGQLLGYENLTSLVIGVCLAITSEVTNSQIILEMGLMKKRLSKVIFGSAMLADLFAIIFLAFLIPFLQGDSQTIATIPVKIIGFVAVIWGLIKIMPYFVTHFEKDESNVAEVAIMIIFGLLVATLSIQLGLGEVVGAFIAGIILQISLRHKCTEMCGDQAFHHQRHIRFFRRNIKVLEVITLAFIIPFFFINMGLQLDLPSIGQFPVVVAAILLAGILGKVIGAIVVKPWTHFTWPQTTIVAAGMNSRGMIELVIAQISLQHGIITTEIYAALVVMVIVTIIAFPVVLRSMIKKYPRAMNLRKGIK